MQQLDEVPNKNQRNEDYHEIEGMNVAPMIIKSCDFAEM